MKTVNLTVDISESMPKEAAYAPWLVCFMASLFFFYEFIQMNMFNAISAQLMQEYSLTAAMLGKLSASYFYANVLFLIPAGFLLDRISTKKIILVSLILCVMGTLAFSGVKTLFLLTLCRFITGIGSAFCFLSCMRLASRWFSKSRMALVSGLIVTMAMIGGIAAQVPLTLLVSNLGWRHALHYDALLGVIVAVLIILFVKNYPSHLAESFDNEREKIQQFGYWKSLSHAFFSMQNWLCGIYTSLLNLPLFLLGGLWGSLYLTHVHHLDKTASSFVTSMIFLGTIIGSPIIGALSDKLETRKIPMLWGAVISFLIFMILLNATHLSFWALIIIFFLLGLSTSTQIMSYPTVTESNPRMLTATCISVVSLCAISGGAIFEPLFGAFIDAHWSGLQSMGLRIYSPQDFQAALWLFPIGIAVAFLAALWIQETFRTSKEPISYPIRGSIIRE